MCFDPINPLNCRISLVTGLSTKVIGCEVLTRVQLNCRLLHDLPSPQFNPGAVPWVCVKVCFLCIYRPLPSMHGCRPFQSSSYIHSLIMDGILFCTLILINNLNHLKINLKMPAYMCLEGISFKYRSK